MSTAPPRARSLAWLERPADNRKVASPNLAGPTQGSFDRCERKINRAGLKTRNPRLKGNATQRSCKSSSSLRELSRGRDSLAGTTDPTRNAALGRMTEALEAAKRARDRGANVQDARRALKEARAAFEAGNYASAIERADYILRLLGSSPARATPAMRETSAVIRPDITDVESARGWIRQATESVQEAKERGLNVDVAKAALTQAKKAFKAGDYRAAVQFADQAVQLCASATLARR